MNRHYKDIKFFNRAEISPQCVRTHGRTAVWHAAATQLEKSFVEMLNRLEKEPEGRIVMAIGWLPPEPPQETTEAAP